MTDPNARGGLAERVVSWLRLRTNGARAARRVRLKVRDIVRSQPPTWEATRDDLAFRYLRGEGIEIGALYRPQRVPGAAHVVYVDHAPVDELRRAYPTHDWVLAPDVVDEAERLDTFDDEHLDFVIANHVLEHVEDPVSALAAFTRVLRPGGILFLTLPDPRHSFDGRRTRTTVAHVLRDHRDGPESSRREHYEEWAHIVEGRLDESDIEQRVAEFASQGTRNHFHVWELETFLELLLALELPLAVEAAQVTAPEFAVILRKG